MQMNKAHYLLAAALLTGMPIQSVAAEAADLVSSMRHAVYNLSYSGTLVYSQGNELSTYQISHAANQDGATDSVLRLSQGEDNSEVGSFSLAKITQVQPQMDQVYSLDLGGQDMIAGRSCQIVVARPNDRLRYLQRYCIDIETGMLLKYALVDRSHTAVEKLVFTSLDIAPVTPKMQESMQPMLALAAPSPSVDTAVGAKNSGWLFDSLPAGFRQTQQLTQQDVVGNQPVKQIILTDGMSSVSVFIAPQGHANTLNSLEFSTGAMNIYTVEIDQYIVTLVGEVPVEALKHISEGLRHVR